MQQAEKWLMLETIDNAWKQHMLNLDHLREGIGLRSWGQKNPLLEYKKEAFDMFQEMMTTIKLDIVHHIFHLNVERFDQHALEARRQRELEQLNFSAAADTTDETTRQAAQPGQERAGRNEPCPCGSGKKYKKCHGVE
jgi:preprotein translocase subunit SecA